MSNENLPPGQPVWIDLTVEDAEGLRDFYAQVVGWEVGEVEMDGYSDFLMAPPGTDEAVAGIVHHRGPNEGMPPQWMLYITVEDLPASVERAVALGGEVVSDRTPHGFVVIKDPAGAVMALAELVEDAQEG
jgi:predicted enzyme related to lactoylglutathione lyase